MIKLSVIIVAYQDMEAIEKCLATLPAADWLEVVVIDNTVNNRGFSKACNQAAKHAGGEVLLFLNPDSELLTGDLKEVVANFNRDKQLGVVGPKLVDTADKITPSYSLQPRATTAPVVYSLLNRIFGNSNLVKKHWLRDRDTTKTQEVGVISGAALFIKSSLFKELGGFDERYFMYWEEVDLCRRVLGNGKKIVYEPAIIFRHIGGTSTKTISAQALEWFKDARFQFFKKYFGPIYALTVEAWLTLTEEWRLVLLSLIVIGGAWIYFWSGRWLYWQIDQPLFFWLGIAGVLILAAAIKEAWGYVSPVQRWGYTAVFVMSLTTVPKLWQMLLVGGAVWAAADIIPHWRKKRNIWLGFWSLAIVVTGVMMVAKITRSQPVLPMNLWSEVLQRAATPFANRPAVACLGCTPADETAIKMYQYRLSDPAAADVVVALPPYNVRNYQNMMSTKFKDVLLLWPIKP